MKVRLFYVIKALPPGKMLYLGRFHTWSKNSSPHLGPILGFFADRDCNCWFGFMQKKVLLNCGSDAQTHKSLMCTHVCKVLCIGFAAFLLFSRGTNNQAGKKIAFSLCMELGARTAQSLKITTLQFLNRPNASLLLLRLLIKNYYCLRKQVYFKEKLLTINK